MRTDGRSPSELRPLHCTTGINAFAEGSCIFEMGLTRVHCTATLSPDLPRWRRDSGLGWLHAEYRMLPRATSQRMFREGRNGVRGRTAEIQRMIGRALRSVVDMEVLGHRQLTLDCDVFQADGGTRTAAVNGAYVALHQALRGLYRAEQLREWPLHDSVAAVSVGLVDDAPLLDLAYEEDSRARVDLNVVMTGGGRFVELQGAAEGRPFERERLDELLEMAQGGIREITAYQRRVLESE